MPVQPAPSAKVYLKTNVIGGRVTMGSGPDPTCSLPPTLLTTTLVIADRLVSPEIPGLIKGARSR
jgi:hypothetical protein